MKRIHTGSATHFLANTKPDAGPLTVTKPDAGSLTVIKPNAGPLTVIKPDAGSFQGMTAVSQ